MGRQLHFDKCDIKRGIMDNLNETQIAIVRCRVRGVSPNLFTQGRFYHGFKEKNKEYCPGWWVVDNLGHTRAIMPNEKNYSSFGHFELVGVLENNLPELTTE